jgi:hypothetical protein
MWLWVKASRIRKEGDVSLCLSRFYFQMGMYITRRPLLRTIVHNASMHINTHCSYFGTGSTKVSHTTCVWKMVFVHFSLLLVAKSWVTRTSEVVKY